MEEQAKKVYAWFEFDEYALPDELLELIYQEDLDEEDSDPDGQTCDDEATNINIGDHKGDSFGVSQGESLVFRRVLGKFVEDHYVFSFYTAGWRNFPFRVHFEIDPDNEINMVSISKFSRSQTIQDYYYADDPDNPGKPDLSEKFEEKYQINLITSGSFCIIDDITYVPKIVSSEFFIHLILTPKK